MIEKFTENWMTFSLGLLMLVGAWFGDYYQIPDDSLYRIAMVTVMGGYTARTVTKKIATAIATKKEK